MRALLDHDPGALLEVADAAAEEFGDGLFGEERAALRVQALEALRDPSWPTAADAFLSRYPDSPQARNVRGRRSTPTP